MCRRRSGAVDMTCLCEFKVKVSSTFGRGLERGKHIRGGNNGHETAEERASVNAAAVHYLCAPVTEATRGAEAGGRGRKYASCTYLHQSLR